MRLRICSICFSLLIQACLSKDYTFTAAPNISSFTSSRGRIFLGEIAALTPVFNDGTGFIDHGVGPVVSDTAYLVSPESDTTYTITVTNAAGTASTAQVSIRVDTAPVTISAFAASSTALSYGQETTLFWTLSGRPTNLMLDGVSVMGQTSRAVSPMRRQTYVLVGANPLGGQRQTLTVAVRGLDVLAGNVGGPGSVDGVGDGARFSSPSDVAADDFGNLYVADTKSQTIRKITADGVVSTLAGSPGISGSADGAGSAARFYMPAGLAVDSFGIVYVADALNSTIRKITAEGVVSTLAGSPGISGSADGVGSAARFNSPADVGVDDLGNLYVADANNHTIRKITPSGVVRTLAGTAGTPGSADGIGSVALFNFPGGLAVTGNGQVYVADTFNHTIRLVVAGGQVTTIAGSPGIPGSADDTGSAARFDYPRRIALDTSGNLYVADSNNSTIRRVNRTGAAVVTTLAGSAGRPGSADGVGSAASFQLPWGVGVDRSGNVYVADTSNDAIRKVTPAGEVSTVAGSAGQRGSTDGTGSAARFDSPQGVAVDGSGQVYVADMLNFTIRRVTPTADVSTLAGSPRRQGSADGFRSAARFGSPHGVATDDSGNIYVADTANFIVRKVTPTGEVSTLAGSAGTIGYADGMGSGARFSALLGVATDHSGNVYVADTDNCAIRKVTPAGEVSTLAGAGAPGSADGTGRDARFNRPQGVAVDGSGNVYVADSFNHTIRKVTPAGEVSTLVGTAGMRGSTDGTGSDARFNFPSAVAVDDSRNIYLADAFNHTVRKVSPEAVVTTIAGRPGAIGAVPGELPATLYIPHGIALTPAGDLIVTSSNGVLQITAF